MTGGACGVLVAGVRVGTTEWERPARLKLAARPDGPSDALGGAGANGRPGRGGCRCAARVGAAAVPGAGVRGAAGPVGVRRGAGLSSGWAGDGGGPAGAGAVRGRGVGVLLPDSMLRRRQYGVEVIWTALLAAAGMPWKQVAAQPGVPFETVRGWLRRFTRRADLVRAWLWGCWMRWWMIRRCRRARPARRPGRWACWRRCTGRCPAGGRWWPRCRRGSWLPGCHGAACFPRPGRRGRSTRVHR